MPVDLSQPLLCLVPPRQLLTHSQERLSILTPMAFNTEKSAIDSVLPEHTRHQHASPTDTANGTPPTNFADCLHAIPNHRTLSMSHPVLAPPQKDIDQAGCAVQIPACGRDSGRSRSQSYLGLPPDSTRSHRFQISQACRTPTSDCDVLLDHTGHLPGRHGRH